MLTKEEIFTKVKNHLLSQNEKAMFDGRCVYRTPTGLKCAIGCLIDDSIYSPYIENLSLYNCTIMQALRNSNIDVNKIEIVDLLRDLQQIHDRYYPDQWEELLEKVRRTYLC